MKLLTFLLFAICVSGMYNLRTTVDDQKQELNDLNKVIVLKDDTILFKTKSLRKIYSDPYWAGTLEKSY